MASVITNPITGETLTDLSIQGVYNLAYRIIEQVINGAEIEFMYPELNRTISEWGAIVGTARVPATESQTVNKNITTKIAPAYPNPSVLYFQTWTEKVYPAEFRRIDANKVLNGEMEFEAFVAKVVNANIEGYKLDVDKGIKAAFSYSTNTTPANYAEIIIDTSTATAPAVATGSKSVLGNMGQYEVLQNATYADIYKELTRVSKQMRFPNTDFSGSFECGATMDDLVIYAPIAFTASASIDFLAKLYNISEAKQLPTIRETDGLSYAYTDANGVAHTKAIILIQDKRFLSHVERFREVWAGRDRDRRSDYNDLHVEDAIMINTLYKAYAIVFDIPQSDDPVTVKGDAELVNG